MDSCYGRKISENVEGTGLRSWDGVGLVGSTFLHLSDRHLSTRNFEKTHGQWYKSREFLQHSRLRSIQEKLEFVFFFNTTPQVLFLFFHKTHLYSKFICSCGIQKFFCYEVWRPKRLFFFFFWWVFFFVFPTNFWQKLVEHIFSRSVTLLFEGSTYFANNFVFRDPLKFCRTVSGVPEQMP